MKISRLKQVVLTILGLLAAVVLFFSPGLRLPVLDDATDVYFKTAIAKGGAAYATCRLINASVSIVKESSLHLEPAGIGISLAVGQALDPIDDLAERVSDVLVTAVMSLGVQKLAYEIGISLAPSVLAVCLLLLSLLALFSGPAERARTAVARLALLIVVARFCLPLSSAANDFIYQRFFNEQIEQVDKNLSAGTAGLDKLKDFSLPEGSLLGTASFLKQKSSDFKEAVAVIGSNMGNLTENLLRLAFLYLGIFLIQVIVLPLLAFFFLVKTSSFLFLGSFSPVPLHAHCMDPEAAAE